jgi:uncharacterized protein (DUF934 family)
MVLVKNRSVAADPWIRVGDDGVLPDAGPVIVSFDRWRRDRASLSRRLEGVGIWLRSDQSPSLLTGDLVHFGVIALEFPKFTDGRAYSYARLLRERYGYWGEVRAVGMVLRDQLAFMARCGFDAFVLPDGIEATEWLASLGAISVRYQPAAQCEPTALALRRGAAVPPNEREPPVAGLWAY